MTTNWAGNHTYAARRIHQPASVPELQDLVARSDRIRALGSRHSFTDLADTEGDLVSTLGLPPDVDLDEEHRMVRVGGGVLYGQLADQLARRRWALPNLASLPHICVAGAVATGTHGSGDRNGSLATAVRAVEYVDAAGEVRHVRRGDADFDGVVVSLGTLGVVTHVTLDVEPAYEVRQDIWTDLPWQAVEADLDAVTGSAYSVSLFTRWLGETVDQVWLKSRTPAGREELFGATRATGTLHMLPEGDVLAVTEQGGVVGPWNTRLPHFRLEFTPSHGAELQSEYFVPRDRALDAVEALRRLGPDLAPYLLVGEVRTIAGDELWLSGAQGRETVAFHFTWRLDVDGVYRVLPRIEDALLPLGGRPHWGKCFVAGVADLRSAYPRFDDFRDLAERLDPHGKFRNAFLERTMGLAR